MLATLDSIVQTVRNPPARQPPEPTYTLERTGPGIFTDAVRTTHEASLRGMSISSTGGIEPPMLYVSRLSGNAYFRHIGRGSWKPYRTGRDGQRPTAASASYTKAQLPLWCSRCLGLAFEEHEVRLTLLVVMAIFGTLSAMRHRTVPSFVQPTTSISNMLTDGSGWRKLPPQAAKLLPQHQWRMTHLYLTLQALGLLVAFSRLSTQLIMVLMLLSALVARRAVCLRAHIESLLCFGWSAMSVARHGPLLRDRDAGA